jgi:hypothetical protein
MLKRSAKSLLAVWEPDERLLPGDARMSPRTALDLLRLLNVDAADDDTQYQPVKGWLYEKPITGTNSCCSSTLARFRLSPGTVMRGGQARVRPGGSA